MLILTRKVDESIVIGDNITITILEAGESVRIGIEAPRDIQVHREEIYLRIVAETAIQAPVNETGGAATPQSA